MLKIILWSECKGSYYSNRIGGKDNKGVFLFNFASYLLDDFLLFFPTEQLAPTKEAILQIESNEFVPQSFSSSAGSKDQQVRKIPFNLFHQELFAVWKIFWIKTRENSRPLKSVKSTLGP